jgi:predicted Zn-dependent protease
MAGVPLGVASAASLRKTRLAWIAVACTLALIVGMWQVRAANLETAQYGRAVSLSTSGRLDDAIAEIRKTVAANPNNVRARVLLGDWLLGKNDPNSAVPVLEQALQVEPGVDLIEYNLALAYLGVGKPHEAFSEITNATMQDNDQRWKKYFIWGVAAEQVGNFDLAAQNLRSAIQLNANFPEAQQALARLDAKPSEKIAAQPIPYSKVIVKSELWPYFP